jgi:hypothetical protein
MRWLHGEILYLSGLAIFFGATCWYLLAAPRPWLAFLNAWPFYLISRLSFGMYLNHFYLLDSVTGFAMKYIPCATSVPSLHHAATALLVTAVSAAVATLTFCVIEFPFLRVRDRLLSSRAGKKHVIQAGDAVATPIDTRRAEPVAAE